MVGIRFYVGDRKPSGIERDTLIELGSGNSFTNNLNSADVWLDIGGDFTNNGSITGSNSVDITIGIGFEKRVATCAFRQCCHSFIGLS